MISMDSGSSGFHQDHRLWCHCYGVLSEAMSSKVPQQAHSIRPNRTARPNTVVQWHKMYIVGTPSGRGLHGIATRIHRRIILDIKQPPAVPRRNTGIGLPEGRNFVTLLFTGQIRQFVQFLDRRTHD